MGTSSDSPAPPENPKNDVVMGYPTTQDKKQMYPPPPAGAPPSDPKGGGSEAPPPNYQQQQYPNPYAYNHYQGYPPAPYPPDPNYMNQQHPPYPYNEYYYQHQHQESNGSASFGRVLLILLLMLISSFMMMSLIMWLLFGASVPEFHVASIKVSNFSATNASVAGAWALQMWVSNVNMELDVRFDHAMSSLFYKDLMLGAAALQPFDVRKTQRFALNFGVPALQDQKWVPPTLAEDRSAGVVVVSLRLAVDANFTSSNGVYRHEKLRVLCEDFPISFASATSGEGTMAPSLGFGNNCFIRLREGRD